jgi:hypothetical protein
LKSLREYIDKERNKFNEDIILWMFYQLSLIFIFLFFFIYFLNFYFYFLFCLIVSALHTIHSKDLLYNDICEENVIVCDNISSEFPILKFINFEMIIHKDEQLFNPRHSV